MKIARWRSGNESIAGWRQGFGAEFDAMRPYLRKCPGLRVKGYPCPDTGLRLTVRERRCGGYTAFATEDYAGYIDDVFLEWDDVQMWRLDEEALVSAVAGALGVEPFGGEPRAVGSDQGEMVDVGVCRRGGLRRRVLMCMAGDGESAIPAVCGIGEGDGIGCVLVPDRFAGVRELLRMKGAAEVLMPECLRIEDGRFCGDCGGACLPVGSERLAVGSGGVAANAVAESPPGANAERPWTFADEGATFRVVMPEGEFTMRKSVGAGYLYWFARNPRKDWSALQVLAENRGSGVRGPSGEAGDNGREAIGAVAGQPVDEVTTRETLENLKQRLREINSERERAEASGDFSRAQKLDVEVAGIEAQIRKDTGLRGRIRKSSNERSKAASAIRRAVNRCYEGLRKGGNCPARTAFIQHFQQYLSIGMVCRYQAPSEKEWKNLKKNIR